LFYKVKYANFSFFREEKMKKNIFIAISLIAAVVVGGCSKDKAQAKSIAKAFFEDVMDDNYTSASRFVHEDDLTALYENWKDMTDMIKGADDWSIDVELTSEAKGKAVCTAEFGRGKNKREVAVAVDLRKKEGEWWIKIAPNPKALEERAKKMQEIKDARLKEEYFGKKDEKETPSPEKKIEEDKTKTTAEDKKTVQPPAEAKQEEKSDADEQPTPNEATPPEF